MRQSRTPEYRAWANMRDRCLNPEHKFYRDYGGRGITICERWLNSFHSFLSDMGPRPKGYSLERIDVNGNYEPENCKWASRAEQNRNRRDNRYLEFNGERKILAVWAREMGIDPRTLRSRLRLGWSVERALTAKPMSREERGILGMQSRYGKKL